MKFGDNKFENPQGWNFSTQYRVLMAVLMTGSTFKMLAMSEVGIFDIVIFVSGIFVLFTRSVLELDFANKQLREKRTLLGIQVYGNWTKFPDFEYVSIFNARISTSYASRGSQSTVVVAELQLNLVYNTNRRLTACIMPDMETALVAAEYFARNLGNLRILNATQKPFVWLDETE